MLLQAYDNEDADSARSALNSPFIKHMDVEYAKLARGLPLPQVEYAVPPAGVRANAAASYISPNATKLTSQATIEAEVNQVTIGWIESRISRMFFFFLFAYSDEQRCGNRLSFIWN